MLGNDIVDLKIAGKESNWRRSGYLEKIFTKFEQNIIKDSLNPDLVVWILWSIKESVYKAHNRISLIYEFAPSKIEIENLKISEKSASAEISYHKTQYFSKTEYSKHFVHTIAIKDSLNFFGIKILGLKTTSRDYTNILLKKNLIKNSQKVQKTNDGIPNIVTETEGNEIPISISHHGSYLGIIINNSITR